MWSQGSWLGGSLVSARCCVASLTYWYDLVFFVVPSLFMFAAIPWWDDTMLSPLAWICQWTGGQSLLFCVLIFVFAFVLCWWFVFALFGLLLKLTAYWTTGMYRSFTSSLLWPSSRRPRVLIWKLMLLQCHRACWTTWRKPWRCWTEKKHARRALCTWAGLGTDPGDDGRTVGGHLLGDPF